MNLIYNKNKQGKIDFFYQPSKEVIVPWAQSPQQFFLRYYPWIISVGGYVLLIKGGDYFTLSKNGNRTRLLKIKNKLIIGCFYK